VRTRGPGARRRGRRVGVCPERDPGSVAGSTGGGRKKLTCGPRASVEGSGGARSGGGERAALGRKVKLGRCARGRGEELRGCRRTSLDWAATKTGLRQRRWRAAVLGWKGRLFSFFF
jgi:hypothetical protein